VALVEITGVERYAGTGRVTGFSIDLPAIGSISEKYYFELAGWAVSKEPLAGVRVRHHDTVLREVAINSPRADVQQKFPHLDAPERCGFWTGVGVVGLPEACELVIDVDFGDGSRECLAAIALRREPLPASSPDLLRPLLLTSLARTGTTWLMRLLAELPNVVVYRDYPFEVRASSYWLHMLRVLSDPANYEFSTHPDSFAQDFATIGHNPAFLVHTYGFGNDILGREYPEELGRLVARFTDRYYRHVAAAQGQPTPTFFAEKYNPGHIPRLAWELYPNAKEIFLVRDLRDVFCSLLAVNAQRSEMMFGRDEVGSDSQYIDAIARDAQVLLDEWQARKDRALLVRYEALVRDPAKVLHSIAEYLGAGTLLEIERAVALASADAGALASHRTSASHIGSIGRWRRDLHPELRDAAREAFDPILREFGYRIPKRKSAREPNSAVLPSP